MPSTGYEELGLPEGLQITFPSGTTLEAPEIRLPTGATVEHDITDHERSHGWDQIKRLPGIEVPQDVGEIVEGGEGLPGRGDYDMIIGDNPNGDGQILLELLEGMIVSASVVEEFPGAEYGEHEEKRDGHTTVVHEQQLEHIRNDHDVTIEQIKEAVESPDELFVAKTPQGQDWYMWVATINGELIVVRAATVGNEVRVGTSFKPEDGYEYVKEWVERHGADRIYS